MRYLSQNLDYAYQTTDSRSYHGDNDGDGKWRSTC